MARPRARGDRNLAAESDRAGKNLPFCAPARRRGPHPRREKPTPVPAGPAVSHAIEQYATWLRVERNLAPRTRAAYVYDLQRFDAWLAEARGGNPPVLRSVQAEHVSAFMSMLREGRGVRAATAARAASSLRGFFNYCVDEGWIEESPAVRLLPPKLPRKLPVYLTDDELKRLFAAPDQSSPVGRRDHAILVVLSHTGMRLSELVGLDTRDIDFPRAAIRVLGKGRKERLCPMNRTVAAVLEGYLSDAERRAAPGERAVFTNARGGRLTGRAVQYIVDAAARAAGLDGRRVSPHKLRHSFATLLHRRDVDLVDIQALLGHASLASTQIYTHVDSRRLERAVARLRYEEPR